jgi:type IV secretion system protein VirD4
MGNCGYQLVFGANDQVTAEAVSKGLGKRTVRYKTESRTIELMGLHRRTKVEQLRERDLMMPQEVRQMPADKMVILAEGQNPIFADKLRFFRTVPFSEMERFSQVNLPDVPAIEFLPQRPVPATTPEYARGDTDGIEPVEQMGEPEEKAKLPRRKPLTVPSTQANGRLRQPSASFAKRASPRASSSVRTTPDKLDARFAKAASRLKTLAKMPAKSGRERTASNWARVFDETIPDELELAEAEAG